MIKILVCIKISKSNKNFSEILCPQITNHLISNIPDLILRSFHLILIIRIFYIRCYLTTLNTMCIIKWILILFAVKNVTRSVYKRNVSCVKSVKMKTIFVAAICTVLAVLFFEGNYFNLFQFIWIWNTLLNQVHYL